MSPLLNTPLSLVIVCVTESLFVHVTLVPTATVNVAGEKEKFDIVTALFPTGAVVDVEVDVVVDEVDALDETVV